MVRMGRAWTVVFAMLGACGDDGGGGTGSGMAQMLNGASPGRVQSVAPLVRAAPMEGIWQVSPTVLKAPLVGLQFTEQDLGQVPRIDLTDCAITFDLRMPGLAQTVACPFTLPAGTYTGVAPVFGATYEATIDDAVNGFYTDPGSPAKLSATAPAGGAAPVTLTNPATMGGSAVTFPAPIVVADGGTIAISVLLNGLQSLQINVTGGVPKFGVDGMGMAGFPSSTAAAGMPAAISYYVNGTLGTPYSYRASAVGMDAFAVGVLYSNDMKPAFLSMGINGQLSNCGPIQARFVFPGKHNGYLGLDSAGVLGWVGYSDGANQTISAEMAMPQASTLGGSTSFKCLQTTTDPMPPGDSFSSGAPMIGTPSRMETMLLVAK